MDHVVAITGANNGIGLAMTRAPLERGDRVAGLDLSTDNLKALRSEDEKLRPCVCDVTDRGEVQVVVTDVMRAWKGVDVLVNNAGIATFKPYVDRTQDNAHREFVVNYFGYLTMIDAVLPVMRRQRQGVTHNLSSGVGITGYPLHRIASVLALALIIHSLATMIVLIFVGGQPETAEEAFAVLEEKRAVGLLRLDVLTCVIASLYYPVYLSLYTALKRTHAPYASLAAVLGFDGITLILANPSPPSLASLSDRFAAATAETERNRFLAAGEAILASDSWHATGATIGDLLLVLAGTVVSAIMLWHEGFGELTATAGMLAHGLDPVHILLAVLLPGLGVILMAMAGVFYLIWFPLLARDLFRLEPSSAKQR